MMIEISVFIKKLRNHFGLTQEQLSEKVGCTTSHLGKIEANMVNPSIDFLEKILVALDIPPSSLLNTLLSQSIENKRKNLIIDIHRGLLELDTRDLEWLLKIIDIAKEKPPRD